jgi:hypothetical protein
MKTLNIISTLLIMGALPCAGFAQQATSNTSIAPGAVDKVGIAKKLANPIANMISVPLQYEFSRGVGANQGGSEQTLLFQPVMPFNLGGGDTFIVRPIVAGVREVSVQGASGQPYSGYGIASVTIESFYAPNTNSSWIWGIGPYAQSPSGNSGKFGSQQTGAGVTGVVLNRHGPWTMVCLVINRGKWAAILRLGHKIIYMASLFSLTRIKMLGLLQPIWKHFITTIPVVPQTRSMLESLN